MIQRTFFPLSHSVSDSIRSSIRALRQKMTFSWPIPNLLLIIPLSKSELTLRETPELGFFTILCSILSFSHVPSSIIYQGSRRMLRARRNRRGKVMASRQTRLPETAEPLSLSLPYYKFCLTVLLSYTQNVGIPYSYWQIKLV